MRIITMFGLAAMIFGGCAGYSAWREAADQARTRATEIGNELAAGVFVDGPNGVELGLERAYVLDRADIVRDDHSATVTLSLASTVFSEGGGFNQDVEESAVICVEYLVELDGGDTVIRDVDCPSDVLSGEHVAATSLGGDVEIDSHDAMRALNRFPHGPDDRTNKYTDTKQAREILPDAIAALEPLSEQEAVTARQLNEALAEIGLGAATIEHGHEIEFGAGIGRGCVFGTVGPGVLDVEAGGYPADGGSCIG